MAKSRLRRPTGRKRRQFHLQGKKLPVRGIGEVTGNRIGSRRVIPGNGPVPRHGVGLELRRDGLVVGDIAHRVHVAGIALPERGHVRPVLLDGPDVVPRIGGNSETLARAMGDGHGSRRRYRAVCAGRGGDNVLTCALDDNGLVVVEILPRWNAQVGIVPGRIAERGAAERQAIHRQIGGLVTSLHDVRAGCRIRIGNRADRDLAVRRSRLQRDDEIPADQGDVFGEVHRNIDFRVFAIGPVGRGGSDGCDGRGFVVNLHTVVIRRPPVVCIVLRSHVEMPGPVCQVRV